MPADRRDAEQLESYRLLAAARDYLDRLIATIRYCELFDGVYAISSRIKNTARLHDKIASRRSAGFPEYSLHSVTDIIGIRFISLYRRDVTRNVRAILDLVAGKQEVSPNALKELRLIELKSYTSNTIPEQDPLNVELRALYDDGYLGPLGNVELQLIPLGRYSSVHMVLKAQVKHDGRTQIVPIELQFRSVFEDAWAEIEHKLLYEVGRYGERVDEAQREAMTQHMFVLKKMVDTAAEYADVIRRTIVIARETPVAITRNLDDAEYFRELAPRAGLSPGLIDDIARSLSAKVALDGQIMSGRSDASALQYADIANSLRALMPAADAALTDREAPAARTIRFSLGMEEALCRLLTGDPQQIAASADSYLALTQEFPEFPAGRFRSAQAHQRLSDISDDCGALEAAAVDTAFGHFGEALTRLDACGDVAPDARILLISPQQEEHIAASAGRLQGFVKWRLSDRRRRSAGRIVDQDLRDVLLSYRVSKDALGREQDAGERIKLINNVLYFAADAHKLAAALGAPDRLPDESELRDFLAQLREAAGNDMLRLDTLVRASLVIGDAAAAADAARKILDLNAEEPKAAIDTISSPYVAEVSARAIRNAWKVVRDAERT